MYHFSKWKYWLVIIVMLVGILYFLPNLYGPAPALQLSRNDRKPIEAEGMQQVRSILDAQKIPIEASYLENDREVLRFDTPELQRQARDAILKGSQGAYLVAFSTVPRTPELLRKIGLKPMSLGLDLRGGVQLTYEVDIKGALNQAFQRLSEDIRTQLRDERIPFVSVTPEAAGNVRVVLRDAGNLDAAEKVIKHDDPDIIITRETDSDPTLTVTFTPQQIKQRQDFAIEQNITTLRNRVDELGVAEPVVVRQGINRIGVQLPGVEDPNQAIRLLGATATVEFRLVDEAHDPYEAASTKRVPIGSKLYKRRESGQPVLLKREVIARGEQLTNATSGFSEGQPAVNVRLNARAGASMLKTTQENLGHGMAVVYIETKRLAEGEVCQGIRSGQDCTTEEAISVATIRGVFSNSFQITGLLQSEARDLALLLRSGSLAAPQSIVEQRSVGPSLGQDNIERGIRAMIIGLVLTFAFMAVYYRAFGWIANAVLAANLVLTVGLLSMLQASLSLPGIAAVVFHLGIAVDANILIYERIREELRAGNSPLAAINAGFDKAFATIADSNVTTLIAGVVLFAFGTGTIRSFAIVMTLGILTSLFTSVVGSRALVHAIWGRRRRLETLPI